MRPRSSRSRAGERARALVVLALVSAAGCRARAQEGASTADAAPAPSTPTSIATSTSTPSSTSTARASPSVTAEDLPVIGYAPAVVIPPAPSSARRPVVLVAHGFDDRAENQCDVWRGIVEGRAYVVCPRGIPVAGSSTQGQTYNGAMALAKEVEGVLAAFHRRYAAVADDSALVFAGFSLGAVLGVSIPQRDPSRFPYVVLTEGGEDAWTTNDTKYFHDHGGKRVLLMCALAIRVSTAEIARDRFTKSGADARVVLAKAPGKPEYVHWYDGPVAEQIHANLDWLVEGDARWAR